MAHLRGYPYKFGYQHDFLLRTLHETIFQAGRYLQKVPENLVFTALSTILRK